MSVLGLAQAPSAAPAAPAPAAAAPQAAVTLEQAIQLALAHSPALQAAATQVPQSLAQETTAALRPNPVLAWDALYQPIFNPSQFNHSYLNNSAEYDASLSYTIERGHKRQARMAAARDVTAVTRAQVEDARRGVEFNVAQQFVAALLAKSTLAFAQQDLASWQNTVAVSQSQYAAGAVSEGDLDTVKLQTLQYQTAAASDQLSLLQALSALRQQMGFSAVPASYAVAGDLAFEPVRADLATLQSLALAHRPDLIAARQGVTAAESQLKLARANGKRDFTVTGEYIHAAGISSAAALFSIEVPIFDRNQGEIARTAAALTQAQDLAEAANQQVLTDVATAFAAVQQGSRVVQLYTSGYRDEARQALTIRQYSYSRGASSLLDLLDAERTYRTTETGYRQALAAYMLAVEQLKEAVGTRTLP
jgi:cobalt-zinc-cadmium efflux system outer membrane protein